MITFNIVRHFLDFIIIFLYPALSEPSKTWKNSGNENFFFDFYIVFQFTLWGFAYVLSSFKSMDSENGYPWKNRLEKKHSFGVSLLFVRIYW